MLSSNRRKGYQRREVERRLAFVFPFDTLNLRNPEQKRNGDRRVVDRRKARW